MKMETRKRSIKIDENSFIDDRENDRRRKYTRNYDRHDDSNKKDDSQKKKSIIIVIIKIMRNRIVIYLKEGKKLSSDDK